MRDRTTRWSFALAVLGTFLWVGATAAPAHADSNFERGFEDQLGRILAYEAVNAGKEILFHGIVHPVHYDQRSYGYRDYGYRDHGYRDRHPRAHAGPQVYRYPGYRQVPVHTHQHGPRPYRFGRSDHRGHGHAKYESRHRSHGWHRGHRDCHGH
ncbi:MAG: hypothetical protein ACQGVC_23745 [Myxococcota bacterium]